MTDVRAVMTEKPCCSTHWWGECDPDKIGTEYDNYSGPCCPRCPDRDRPKPELS